MTTPPPLTEEEFFYMHFLVRGSYVSEKKYRSLKAMNIALLPLERKGFITCTFHAKRLELAVTKLGKQVYDLWKPLYDL